MKKIADTVDGNVLIEMSQVEWSYLQQRPQSKSYEIAFHSLEEWRNDFLNGVKKLDLSVKVFNALERSCSIQTTRWIRNDKGERVEIEVDAYINGGDFIQNGRLLSFDEWCDYMVTHPNSFYAGRGIGKKGEIELLDAVKKYRLARSG